MLTSFNWEKNNKIRVKNEKKMGLFVKGHNLKAKGSSFRCPNNIRPSSERKKGRIKEKKIDILLVGIGVLEFLLI